MVDLEVVKRMGGTEERLKNVFTAAPASPEHLASMTDEQQRKCEKDCKTRETFEADISRRLSAQLGISMNNGPIYGAVDLAWDAAPINKATYPLLMYAQGKLNLAQCAAAVDGLPSCEKYTKKDTNGNVTEIDLPKFFEVNFNLVRSVLTRRLAAQANKYLSLYPCYKYEPRGTSNVAKLRADVLSQVMDIMADNYDHRNHDIQVYRDAMLYAHSLDFIRSVWEREEQQVFDTSINPELRDEKNPVYKVIIEKEGVAFTNPHPSRVGWDNAYPLRSINSDTGCEFMLYWDVIRYGDVANNVRYWNRDRITYTSSLSTLFSTYGQYFSQYYCTLSPPPTPGSDPSAPNDRMNNVGIYAESMADSSMVKAEYFRKLIPKDVGLCDYPYPVWMRMIVAGDKTVLFAEFLPSTPCAYAGINENDSRQLSISIAMELLPYQDQMTQLLSLLMLTLRSSNLRVLTIDTDVATPEQIDKFRKEASAENRFATCTVFEYSGIKMRERGVDVKGIISMVETQPSQALTHIFTAMAELVKLAERLMALSPQELGQPAPSGISATETNLIGATTETMYAFISDAFDAFRSAKKRILYESYMVCGDQKLRVPVLNRYTRKIIAKAGFEILDEDAETPQDVDDKPSYHTVTGTKGLLSYSYIYTSRDGALRAVNTQSANVLTQLLAILQNPIIMQALGKEKFYNVINEIFRLSGAAVDLNLELADGESDAMGPDRQQQMEQVLQQLTQHVEQSAQQIQQLTQQSEGSEAKFQELTKIVNELMGKIEQVDSKPTSMMIDPLKNAQTEQKMLIDRAEAEQRLASSDQDMRHAEEAHTVDTSLKLLKPMSE